MSLFSNLFGTKEKQKKVIKRIPVEEHGEPKYLYRYKLTLEDFREYNLAVSAGNIEKDKKSKRIWGIIELLGGVAFAVVTYLNWADSYARQSYIVATLLLLGFGFYTFFYHKLFFAKKLEKSSKNYYDNSVYLQNYITEAFYEEGVLEKAAPRDAFFTWDKFDRAWNSENLFYLEFNLANQLILPIRMVTGDDHTLDEMLDFCNSRIEAARKAAEEKEAAEDGGGDELPEDDGKKELPGDTDGDKE